MVHTEQTELPFDILSYPLSTETQAIVVDTDPTLLGNAEELRSPDVLYIGDLALGETDAEAAAQYIKIAGQAAESPSKVMLISDRHIAAGQALEAGMGMATTSNVDGLATTLDLLLDPRSQTDQPLYERSLYTDLSYQEVAEALYQPGEINVVGFVGRTGAGKSTTINRLVGALEEVGGHGGKFEVDSFFIRTRKDRKAWLNEPGISEEERADRKRVVTWWDLGRTADTLERIKRGEHVHLEGLYDMQQGGEMVGTLDIDPGTEGYTVFVEGTALLVPELVQAIGSFVYLNTHDQVRAGFLMERNLRDGYTPQESHARKVLTDAAETNEHIARNLRVGPFAQANLTVLDNTHRGEYLRLLPPYIPEK
jgi:uridine kinase